MKTIQQQKVEAKKSKRAKAIREVKCFYKRFSFTNDTLKYALAKEGKANEYL